MGAQGQSSNAAGEGVKAAPTHWPETFKQLIEIFGVDWLELASLNQQALIDAILSDDVDTFLFGARMVLKNPDLAQALARLWFGDKPLYAYEHNTPDHFRAWLPQSRAAMTEQVHTNANGLMAFRHPSLSIPSGFPFLDVLEQYPSGRALDVPAGGARDERDRVAVAIQRQRNNVSTDGLLEYSVKQLVGLVERGIKGKHPEPGRRAGVSRAGGGKDKARAAGKPQRQSRRYDTESVGSHPVVIALDASQEDADKDEGGNDQGEGGDGKRKKKAVEDPAGRGARSQEGWEDRHGCDQRKDAAVRQDDDDDEGPDAAATTQASSSQYARPAVAEKPKPKCKARQAKADEREQAVVRGNPYASVDSPNDSINDNLKNPKPSSLSLRSRGFMFTWPDTDDPAALIVDTEARDDLPTAADYPEVEKSGMLVYRCDARPSSSKRRAKPRPRAKAAEKEKEKPAEHAIRKGNEHAVPAEATDEESATHSSGARQRKAEESSAAEDDAEWSLYGDYPG
ncbi:hypothetical protein BN946_scf184677.g6 [Trametes cinnabarina]|uniref:XPG-I domain-containing protein n=1 Tax=Pycnoporus cinnabarinus TaxID=5643 RepID=A0A060SR97_PYCCI|nr:hypothetical protein BN946_scf184677.g6 [Trametes cinnabarina]